MSNETKLPEFAKWAKGAIEELGIPTVLIIVFLLMYMGILPSGVTAEFDKRSKEHLEILDMKARGFVEIQKTMVEHNTMHMRLVRQICRNTAKNEFQAIECDR